MRKKNRVRIAALLFLAAMLLAGCVAGEREQKKAGTAIMKEYFKQTGKNATISNIYADITRPAADRLEMSDYVKGEYRLGDQTYEFRANVETGSIYTTERMDEFGESVLRAQAGSLGLDPDDCTCNASINMEPSFTGETGNSRGQEDTIDLYDVLPVTITDMDEFTKEVLAREDVFVRSIIICRNMPDISREAQPGAPDWTNIQITVCALDDPAEELPKDKYDILRYWARKNDEGRTVDIKY